MSANDPSTTAIRYSLAAIILHWLLAAALIFQLAMGLGLEDLGAKAFAQYQLHKSMGIAILMLTLLRIGMRLGLSRPSPVERGWAGFLASSVHAGLYAFMIGAPLTGWMLVSTAKVKVPTLLFGTVPLPHLPLPDSFRGFSASAHEVVAFLGMALIFLHIAGALRHHWLLRDGLIYRMTPVRSWVAAALLAALLPAGWVAGRTLLAASEAPVAKPFPSPARPLPSTGLRQPQVLPANELPPAKEAKAEETSANEADRPAPSWSILPGGGLAFTAAYGSDSYQGSFSRWSGEIIMDPDRPESASIRIDIDMSSATMNDATQNEMLAGEDFFAVSQFSKATFRSAKVEKTGPTTYRANGTLSLKGISAPQTVRFDLTGSGEKRHVSGSAEVNRLRYGVGSGNDTQGIAPDVNVSFTFDAKANISGTSSQKK